jgi:hypothetical protein
VYNAGLLERPDRKALFSLQQVLYKAAIVEVKFRTILKYAGVDASGKPNLVKVRGTCR